MPEDYFGALALLRRVVSPDFPLPVVCSLFHIRCRKDHPSHSPARAFCTQRKQQEGSYYRTTRLGDVAAFQEFRNGSAQGRGSGFVEFLELHAADTARPVPDECRHEHGLSLGRRDAELEGSVELIAVDRGFDQHAEPTDAQVDDLNARVDRSIDDLDSNVVVTGKPNPDMPTSIPIGLGLFLGGH